MNKNFHLLILFVLTYLNSSAKVYKFVKEYDRDTSKFSEVLYIESIKSDSINCFLLCKGAGRIPPVFYINSRTEDVYRSHKNISVPNIGWVDASDLIPSHINLYNDSEVLMKFDRSLLANDFDYFFRTKKVTSASFFYDIRNNTRMEILATAPPPLRNTFLVGIRLQAEITEAGNIRVTTIIYIGDDVSKAFIKQK